VISRDVEFDLENDKMRCLKGLTEEYAAPSPTPPAVLRVTQIFDNPQFIVDGADAIDIIQGNLGDCWLLSALSTVSTSKGLIEKLCVAVSHFDTFLFSVSYAIVISGTKRLVCTDLCSSAVLLGLALLLTSKILIDTRQTIPEQC
jgi:hypothetical protein